jgi:hypothetical protein
MTIPNQLVPILKKLTVESDQKLSFWLYLDHMDLTEKLFELSSALMIEQIELTGLPKGYQIIAYIFYWETNCQFSGWYALENLSGYLGEIVNSYKEIGLDDEALGIQKAAELWDESLQNYDEVSAAYKSVSNPYADENMRWDYINKFIKKNANSLFY